MPDRRLSNVDEVEGWLLQKQFKVNRVVDMASYSFKRQLEQFATADLILAVHGAHMVWGLFAKQQVSQSELDAINFTFI